MPLLGLHRNEDCFSPDSWEDLTSPTVPRRSQIEVCRFLTAREVWLLMDKNLQLLRLS